MTNSEMSAEIDRLRAELATANAYEAHLRAKLAQYEEAEERAIGNLQSVAKDLREVRSGAEALMERCTSAEAERDDAQAEATVLMEALEAWEKMMKLPVGANADYGALRAAQCVAENLTRDALARTPDRYRRRIVVAGLREANEEIDKQRETHIMTFGTYTANDAQKIIQGIIERLEPDA